MIYLVLRVAVIPVAYLGWLFFELVIKKKKWSMIKQDAFVGICFIVLATLIYYWLSK